jgi:adenine C2-methylase RlmN of 23S rRNA A2503 and tRNA A37
MSDREKAIDAILNFLNNKDSKILLVRGYDNDVKLNAVMNCLNNKFDKGIIRTSSMSDISFHFSRAFKKNPLPSTVKSTTTYDIGRMTVKINSYSSNTQSNPSGNENTFTLYYPVQTVLDDSKRYAKFLEDLKDAQSRKVILITTNEWSIKNWDIENHVDEVFFYSVEEDNPEIMTNLRNNGAI